MGLGENGLHYSAAILFPNRPFLRMFHDKEFRINVCIYKELQRAALVSYFTLTLPVMKHRVAKNQCSANDLRSSLNFNPTKAAKMFMHHNNNT